MPPSPIPRLLRLVILATAALLLILDIAHIAQIKLNYSKTHHLPYPFSLYLTTHYPFLDDDDNNRPRTEPSTESNLAGYYCLLLFPDLIAILMMAWILFGKKCGDKLYEAGLRVLFGVGLAVLMLWYPVLEIKQMNRFWRKTFGDGRVVYGGSDEMRGGCKRYDDGSGECGHWEGKGEDDDETENDHDYGHDHSERRRGLDPRIRGLMSVMPAPPKIQLESVSPTRRGTTLGHPHPSTLVYCPSKPTLTLIPTEFHFQSTVDHQPSKTIPATLKQDIHTALLPRHKHLLQKRSSYYSSPVEEGPPSKGDVYMCFLNNKQYGPKMEFITCAIYRIRNVLALVLGIVIVVEVVMAIATKEIGFA